MLERGSGADDEGLRGLMWSPRGFLLLTVATMVVVGALSWVFVNARMQFGVALPEEVRAAYWGASIAAGIGLAGALVAIVLARRSQQTSLEILRLERRAERRELDALVRDEALGTADCLRSLGDACFEFVLAWAPVQKGVRPQLVRNWLLRPTAPNQDLDLGHLTEGYTPTDRMQSLALEGTRRLTAAIDRVLSTPAALTAMRTLPSHQEVAENSDVGDFLILARSYLVSNLRDFPSSELIGLSAIVGDSLAPAIGSKLASREMDEETREQRNMMACQAAFAGTLITRKFTDAGVRAAGIEIVAHLLALVPDRESLKSALTHHFLESAYLDSADRATIEGSVDRVLKSGGVGQRLLAPYSDAMLDCARIAAAAARDSISLEAPPVNPDVLEDVLRNAIRLDHQAAEKLRLANVMGNVRLQMEALSDRYKANSLLARFRGNGNGAFQEAMWQQIWALGQRASLDTALAREVFGNIATTAWLLSQPLAETDGETDPSRLVGAVRAEDLFFQRNFEERLRSIKATPPVNATIAKAAQAFVVVLGESPVSEMTMIQVFEDLENADPPVPTGIPHVLLNLALLLHPHLAPHFGDDQA